MKILNDTLKDKFGKYSRRSLTMFVFSILGGLSGVYVIISDLFLTKEINPYAVGVVGLFLSMATGQAIIISKDKKNENNNTQE